MNNIKILNKKTKEIIERGWIKSLYNGTNGCGLMFETLLGKEFENFEIPDYHGIEIKTKSTSKNEYIKMFNASPDGEFLFEIKRIHEKYGYHDKKISNVKVFNTSIYTNQFTTIGLFLFKLEIDKNNNKVFLLVFDKNLNLIDKETSWTFQLLDEKLNRKMQRLAIIKAKKKKFNNYIYYRYQNIKFYSLKSFNYFVDSIEKGIIRITFKINVFRSGKRYGQIHDHGTTFEIKEQDILYIYDEIVV